MWKHHPVLAWWEWQERGTLRASALTELQFNQNPQMDENEKPFLAVPEKGQVARGVAGESPSVLSHPIDSSLPAHIKSVQVRTMNYIVTIGLWLPLPPAKPQCPLCDLGYPTPLWGGWMLRWMKGAQWLHSPSSGWRLRVSSLWEFRAGWWAQRRLWGKEKTSVILNPQTHGGLLGSR